MEVAVEKRRCRVCVRDRRREEMCWSSGGRCAIMAARVDVSV